MNRRDAQPQMHARLTRRVFAGTPCLAGVLAILICVHPCSSVVPFHEEEPARERIETSIARGVEILLSMQQGDNFAEWPYEGVYRVQREIPIGYRVGGTAIAATALLHAPQLQKNVEHLDALERAIAFVVDSTKHPLMAHDFHATYDVRGWAYVYGLSFLLRAVEAGFGTDEVENAIVFFIDGILKTEIPRHGGWNYARRAGFDQPGPPSPFMTAATLQALFEAAHRGHEIPEDVIERGLASLQRAKQASGGYVYSGFASERSRDGVPGAVGRMLIAESTLHLAGRASQADVRGAIDAFLVHWEWLEKRRAQHGTHAPPYGVAPYYFFFAHYYAAQAVELMPRAERGEYRRRISERLFSVQEEDGSWNDRVFDRSAAYGTAMSMLALMMPELPEPARWNGPIRSPSEAASGDPNGQ